MYERKGDTPKELVDQLKEFVERVRENIRRARRVRAGYEIGDYWHRYEMPLKDKYFKKILAKLFENYTIDFIVTLQPPNPDAYHEYVEELWAKEGYYYRREGDVFHVYFFLEWLMFVEEEEALFWFFDYLSRVAEPLNYDLSPEALDLIDTDSELYPYLARHLLIKKKKKEDTQPRKISIV